MSCQFMPARIISFDAIRRTDAGTIATQNSCCIRCAVFFRDALGVFGNPVELH